MGNVFYCKQCGRRFPHEGPEKSGVYCACGALAWYSETFSRKEAGCVGCKRIHSLFDLWCRRCGELGSVAASDHCTKLSQEEAKAGKNTHRWYCQRCLDDIT